LAAPIISGKEMQDVLKTGVSYPGSPSGEERILRGGSRHDGVRSDYRHFSIDLMKLACYGFHLAMLYINTT
jgi:hypothetical protein